MVSFLISPFSSQISICHLLPSALSCSTSCIICFIPLSPGFDLETPPSPLEESSALFALMEHPILVSAATAFKAIPEKLFPALEQPSSEGLTPGKLVYVFQREYATVDLALVDFIGTDEATTCVGIVIRNRDSGLISVAHLDSPNVVNAGLSQMLGEVVGNSFGSELDVHLVGSFDDGASNQGNHRNSSNSPSNLEGYSLPLCAAIIKALENRREKFHIQTLCILDHNTRRDSEGFSYPIFTGLLVETATGSILPARFDATTRCPDELVRRIRISASFEDSRWRGKLLETYNTQTDQFIISPCCWSLRLVHIASALQRLPDSEILQECSTSPSAEAPDFVYNQRRQWDYLIQHPNSNKTFPKGKARVFKRVSDGGWEMVPGV